MKHKTGDTFIVNSIESSDERLVKRLYELGFFPGLEVTLINQVSFGGVYIVQFHHSLIALNESEFLCLK